MILTLILVVIYIAGILWTLHVEPLVEDIEFDRNSKVYRMAYTFGAVIWPLVLIFLVILVMIIEPLQSRKGE